jgi:NAD-dependent dihydropyrimidine dehydrogenase PreA subunit
VTGGRNQVLVVTPPDPLTATGGEVAGAHLDGVGPISSATAQLLACDADITVVTIDQRRRVWDVGRADGNPSVAQRKAVVARDVTCVGCGAPAARCQIHHIRWRSAGGPTIVDNLVLVCWPCHQGIHLLDWHVTRTRDGTFTITPP